MCVLFIWYDKKDAVSRVKATAKKLCEMSFFFIFQTREWVFRKLNVPLFTGLSLLLAFLFAGGSAGGGEDFWLSKFIES